MQRDQDGNSTDKWGVQPSNTKRWQGTKHQELNVIVFLVSLLARSNGGETRANIFAVEHQWELLTLTSRRDERNGIGQEKMSESRRVECKREICGKADRPDG